MSRITAAGGTPAPTCLAVSPVGSGAAFFRRRGFFSGAASVMADHESGGGGEALAEAKVAGI
jgi:hypothetical protein